MREPRTHIEPGSYQSTIVQLDQGQRVIVTAVGDRMILELWRGFGTETVQVAFVEVPLVRAQEISNAILVVSKK